MITKLLTLALAVTLTSQQAQRQSSNKDNVVYKHGIMVVNGDNWKAVIMDKPEETDLFLMLEDRNCKECKRGITELTRVAAQLNETTTSVGILDCQKNTKLCEVWGFQEPDGDLKGKPLMLYVSERQVFKFQGEIDSKSILQWLREGHFRSDMISDSMINHVIEGEKQMFDRADRKQMAQNQASGPMEFDITKIPGFKSLEKNFDDMFRSTLSYIYYQMGKDHYSKFTKVTLFVLLILIPSLMVIFIGGASKLLDIVDHDDEDEPLPNIQSQIPQQLQQPYQPAHQPVHQPAQQPPAQQPAQPPADQPSKAKAKKHAPQPESKKTK